MRRWTEAFILCSKIIQSRLHRGTLKCSIFQRNLCGQPVLLFFHKWDSSRMYGKQRHFYPPVFLDFSIALEAIIMMNVLPSNTARGATTRTQPEWTRELPHRLEECCHAAQILFGRALIVSYCCWIILLFNWCCRIYLILINIVVNNEVLRFVIECRLCFYLVE